MVSGAGQEITLFLVLPSSLALSKRCLGIRCPINSFLEWAANLTSSTILISETFSSASFSIRRWAVWISFEI
ncbi:hypothetical protein AMJ44_08450 [candidate division WOR-1 bacterium DG_54_3]|uniref:Uncharacterized protein n=1 Tax=candidate division WOR-1 bacterium DG_54_3 TaxID=1703775 RepID=A0A0S7XV61_UNCSA|nr:MAG: hypothetical protein AMJ44_08450 [candidate division WOR-1 bacterium DG_54_3]